MNKLKRMNGRERTFLLITIPILALFFCFNTLPLIKGVIYSFTNFRGYGEFDWVGIRNYTDLFTDARVGKSYLFTFKLAIVATIVVNVLSLVLALGLNSKIKFKSAVILTDILEWIIPVQSIPLSNFPYLQGRAFGSNKAK